ncbi:uncharacterized protein LOC119399306 isoform X4 [Rhipicephalus sanguineus]|uniref:uncharacterized protein LOC119399306 isoform X4 n=1 Tax=Rhipicephalus sanguineus TaxID=34632 RepID=UPI0020C37F74|nr:uncharacterized protein LOC119399306 isoform X4 [Rhipicephalus sanguineus]
MFNVNVRSERCSQTFENGKPRVNVNDERLIPMLHAPASAPRKRRREPSSARSPTLASNVTSWTGASDTVASVPLMSQVCEGVIHGIPADQLQVLTGGDTNSCEDKMEAAVKDNGSQPRGTRVELQSR